MGKQQDNFAEPETIVVRVTLLRRNGKRLKNGDAQREQQYRGSISDHWRNTCQVLTMRTGLPTDAKIRLPPDLFKPIIAQVGGRCIRILGYENRQDGTFAQEWMVEYL